MEKKVRKKRKRVPRRGPGGCDREEKRDRTYERD